MNRKENPACPDLFSTTDLALATAISLYYPIEKIDKNNPEKLKFIFNRDEHFDELLETYWKNKMLVNPVCYFNQLKFIKTRLRSGE